MTSNNGTRVATMEKVRSGYLQRLCFSFFSFWSCVNTPRDLVTTPRARRCCLCPALFNATQMMTVRCFFCLFYRPVPSTVKQQQQQHHPQDCKVSRRKMKDPCLDLGAATTRTSSVDDIDEVEDEMRLTDDGQSTGDDELIAPPLRHKKSSALRAAGRLPGLSQWQTIPEEVGCDGEDDHPATTAVNSAHPPRRQRKLIHIQELDVDDQVTNRPSVRPLEPVVSGKNRPEPD